MSVALHAFPDEADQAGRLARALNLPLALVEVHAFPDGEILPRVPATASTTIVYRSLNQPNARLVELLLAVDAWRSNGANRLVLVAPYLPYMRQDKAFKVGEPVSQRVLARLLDAAFDRIITVDPHLHRTNSLVDIFPTCESTHLHGADALVPFLRRSPLPNNTLVVGPDAESGPWVRRIADPLGLEYATMRKDRRSDTEVAIRAPTNFAPGQRPVLLVDDICSTGTTLREATSILKAAGAGPITIFVTHAIGGPATTAGLLRSGASRVISTDACGDPSNEIELAELLAASLKEHV